MGRERAGRTRSDWACAVATAGGLGWLPASGTWGSVVGLAAGIAAIDTWRAPTLLAGLLVTFPLCASLCSIAEQRLGRHDPPQVILDELWAMAAVIILQRTVIGASGWFTVWAFLLFRFFDVVKPAPLTRLARLPAGWGIMADDLGAAAYTCAILWGIHQITNFGF